MKKIGIVIPVALVLGIVGWWYFTNAKGKADPYVVSTESIEEIDMEKYLAEVDAMSTKNGIKPEDMTQEDKKELAKNLILPSRLYKDIFLSRHTLNWPSETFDDKEEKAEKYLLGELDQFEYDVSTRSYSIEEIKKLFQALWKWQEFPSIEKEIEICDEEMACYAKPKQEHLEVSSVRHTQCAVGSGENCKAEYFSYTKKLLPDFLHRKYEENTEATGKFCYRNFTNGNCEKGYVFSQRVGDYEKITFCDAYIDGICQGNYILRKEEPACHCGPSVSVLEIKQNGGKWQYGFEEYTPHKITHKTTCNDYNMANGICMAGDYIQEETEGETDEELVSESLYLEKNKSITYQIKNGKLVSGPKPLEETKPLLQLPKDIITK